MSRAAAYADLTSLVQKFAGAKKDAKKASEHLLDEAAQKTADYMMEFAPVRTGRLRAAIRYTSSPGRREVGPFGVPYAVYQEFGTATRGEFGGSTYTIKPKRASSLRFKIDGRWINVKEVRHPGIPASPFARPAAKRALEDIGERYAETGLKLFMEGGHRAA